MGRSDSAHLSGQRALERPPRAPVESPAVSLQAERVKAPPQTNQEEMLGFYFLLRIAKEGSGDINNPRKNSFRLKFKYRFSIDINILTILTFKTITVRSTRILIQDPLVYIVRGMIHALPST